MGELDTSEMRALATGMFSESRDTTQAMIQGFDAVRFAGPAVEALASEPEEHITLQGDTASLVDTVLCPSRRDRDRLSVHWCVGAFYTSVSALPDGAARLARLVSTAQSPRVADTIAINLMTHVGTPAALGLVDALDDASAPMALRGIADYGGWSSRYATSARVLAPDPDAFVAWVRAAWKSRPTIRGALLYALTQVDSAKQGTVPWGKLPAFLGSAIGSADFDAFLGQGRRAFWSIDTVAQGLSTGWSRSHVIVPRFEQWLGDLATYDDGGPYREAISERIVTALCLGHDAGDVSAFQGFVRSRIESFPREKGQYGDLPNASPASLCKVNLIVGDSNVIVARRVPTPAQPPAPAQPPETPHPPAPAQHPQHPPAAPRPQNPAAVPVLFGDD
jgi:hypothetical protein